MATMVSQVRPDAQYEDTGKSHNLTIPSEKLDTVLFPAVDETTDDSDTKSVKSDRTNGCDSSLVSFGDAATAAENLQALVSRETLTPDFLSTTQQDGRGGVSEEGRRDLLIWLREFNLFFGLSPGTYAVAADLVDRMLQSTRVKPEHADLVGVACLSIAAKLGEPRDVQPSLRELSRNCDGAFSESDIDRMESLVHRKLGSMSNVLPLDFLDEIIAFSATLGAPLSVIATASFEKLTTNTMLMCSFHYELMSYRPSVLALAVFSVSLSRIGEASAFSDTLEKARTLLQIETWDLRNCRSKIVKYLNLKPCL